MKLRCAIYTRKSSEEGLEQEFNSLDAQRESCLSYIKSQKSEGWIALSEYYDDGGYSGGNLERPALKRLMDDIQSGKVDIIVVYKIDRLTRSLMDFAKLVEVFDKHRATFVSVTQSFNTTTSMGRLTLNVLLSFAQFEREVTGERIRDKISASKKKGMWMGGVTPFGYDNIERKLAVNEAEAVIVRDIFQQYLLLGNIQKLKHYLDNQNILSKKGASFSRGLLYKILCNPVYMGKIRHKDNIYEGQHVPIVSDDLWNKVQEHLSGQAAIQRGHKKSKPAGSLLKGLLYDVHGNKYTPTYTTKGNRQYRYYINQAALQNREILNGIIVRLPAYDLEDAVLRIVKSSQTDENQCIEDTVSKVIIDMQNIILYSDNEVLATIPINQLKRISDSTITQMDQSKKIDPFDKPSHELKKWVQGIIWRDSHFAGKTMREIANAEGCSESRVAQMITATFSI